MFDRIPLKYCLRDPIPEIFTAARLLNMAVSSHLKGDRESASSLIIQANIPAIREWTESLWGKNSPYVKARYLNPHFPVLLLRNRIKARMPTSAEKKTIHMRDGHACRFCQIPVVRREVRQRIKLSFPRELMWGSKNQSQHAAFQAMWAQYDHLIPHARGGDNSLANILLTCAPCNFARMNYLVEEVGLEDPRSREPVSIEWDGLERFK